MGRIVMIEDDLDLAGVTRDALMREGFEVYHAASGIVGLTDVCEVRPDLVLLDLGLPDVDGALVLTQLRRLSDVPVIVFSGRGAVEEKVALLKGGASDYVVKPCDVRELLARVGAQLRSAPGTPRVIGKLTVMEARGAASYDGMIVDLTPTEFSLLALLAREPGRVFSREDIVGAVWHGGRVTLQAVNANVCNIRAKLRAVGAPNLIRSLRGAGYALYGA